jgi:hypothetical protein
VTFSNLKIELIATGEQSGTWGATTNNNLGSNSAGSRGLEQAVVGMATLVTGDFTANSYTLAYTDSNDAQDFRALVLNITATLSAAGEVIVPAIEKPYLVFNNSVGGFDVTVLVSGETGITVPNGQKAYVYNDGTDVGDAFTWLSTLELGGDLRLTSGAAIDDANGNELIKFPSTVASAVNELTVSNAATGASPSISATGGDTNIDITLTPKGSGSVKTDNLSLNGNTLAVTDTNGDLTLAPDGTGGLIVSGTNSVTVPNGTTAQRDGTPASGMLRFNSDSDEFEGYNGTAWASVGGSAITNDTSTVLGPVSHLRMMRQPGLASAANVYTSNAQYLFKPSTGELKVKAPVASNGIVVNADTMTSNYTIDSGTNGLSVGPFTIDSGVTLTIASGQRHLIL